MDQVKTTHGSIDSLSHLSQCSSPRMEALSEDQFSLKSEDSRVKFLCSYGGRIMPRPHDCQLRYAGGETRLLVVSRNITLADLMAKLTRLCGKSVLALKFQLPNEDLDSLVSVLCEEDLENMMEEYDRLESRDASVRLRLFLFPAKSHSVSLDFHEYDSRNAEQRFVDAVNGNFSRRQNSMPTSQGLPDFLFGLDIFEKQARLPGALPKASSQPLPCTRSYHEGVLEKDQLSLLNSPPILQPLVNSQQEAASKQHPTILLDSEIPISNPPTISVADHSLEDLEVIKQLSSLIPTPLELQVSEKKPSLDTVLGSCDEEKNWKRNFQTKPELDLARELNLSPTLDDPHKSTKGGLSTSSAPIDDNQRKDPLSVRVRAEINSPVESPAEGGGIKGSNSSTYNQHLPKVLHGLPVLSDKPDYFPADLNSNVQRTKSVSNQVNGDVSTLGGQKPEPRTEFARNQQHSSDKQGGDGDQKDQKEGERPSEDHTESLTSHGKAKRYPFLNAEGQQEINDKASRHIREAYKFEDTEIPLKSTVAQHSNQQHVVQPHVIASNNTHANQWQKEDQIRQHIDGGAVQLPHTSASPQQTGPSQFPPPTILRVTSASPPSRAYDLPRSAHRQCMAAPQPAHLHRQLTAAMTYSELQQQPSPLPKIKVGQPTTRDQTVPRATRVQSPSRFRDMPPSTPFQVQWVNSEERMLMRSVHHLSGGTMLHSIQQDHYVDPNGHLLCDPSITQSQYYADHVNTSEFTPFNIPHNAELIGHSNDQPLDSHAYQGGVALAHHVREPQAGSAEDHRHVIHQVMRT
ncbi:hypothetical protein O6H91_01G024600 [Diphasiastrum complanatum]|uniref:Uncharacterized protein n=2 Tax=Diphasiastrum complanatum TaxID=34168 RepID=A0ACC2EP67_DIPCM|nr:hypothetical protein O6H91_01G024600 [Diphasiastrum complanatum]